MEKIKRDNKLTLSSLKNIKLNFARWTLPFRDKI